MTACPGHPLTTVSPPRSRKNVAPTSRGRQEAGVPATSTGASGDRIQVVALVTTQDPPQPTPRRHR